jgi:hypothetical protein
VIPDPQVIIQAEYADRTENPKGLSTIKRPSRFFTLATFRRKIVVFGIVAYRARKTTPAGGDWRVLKSLIDSGRQALTVKPAFPSHGRC